jgi:hypothetical protein
MDLKSIKTKLSALQSTGQKKEKIDYSKYLWKPKQEGKYQIRFVPSKLDKDNPFQEIFIHYGYSKFPIYALTNWNEKDPIVEFTKQLRNTNDSKNWKTAKKLDPKMRVFAPVIVRGEEEKGVRLWEFGKEIYMQLLGLAEDEDYGDYTDINEGRDFTIEAHIGDVSGRQGLKCAIRVKPKVTALSNDAKQVELWLEEQPDLLSIQKKYEFQELKQILQNWLNPEEADEVVADDEEEIEEVVKEEKPTKNYSLKSNNKKVSTADKFDALFDEDEDGEEDEDRDLPF